MGMGGSIPIARSLILDDGVEIIDGDVRDGHLVRLLSSSELSGRSLLKSQLSVLRFEMSLESWSNGGDGSQRWLIAGAGGNDERRGVGKPDAGRGAVCCVSPDRPPIRSLRDPPIAERGPFAPLPNWCIDVAFSLALD